MKLVLRLTSSIFRRWDFWLAVGLYVYFLCMPLYSEYKLGGALQPCISSIEPIGQPMLALFFKSSRYFQ